jgi:hypothetical protein
MYGAPVQFRFKGTSLSRKTLMAIYYQFEEYNQKHSRFIQFPTYVFYTNIAISKEENGSQQNNLSPLEETTWNDIFILGKRIEGKYYSLNDLTTMQQKFKEDWGRPSESEVKNLFYFWINPLATFDCDSAKMKTEREKTIDQIFNKIVNIIYTNEEIKSQISDENQFKKDYFEKVYTIPPGWGKS